MAYAYPFIKFSWGGTLADGLEIWSCGLSMVIDPLPGSPFPQWDTFKSNFASYVSAVETFITTADANVPTGVQLGWVKGALIDTDGTYMDEPVESPATASGTQSGGYLPQGALVYTLVSARWKDPGRYNRFYLPTAAPTGTTAWRLSEIEAQDAADAGAAFIDSLNLIGGTGFPVVSVLSPAGSGWSYAVEEVRVGRIIDTQRRRRNAIAEDYHTSPVV